MAEKERVEKGRRCDMHERSPARLESGTLGLHVPSSTSPLPNHSHLVNFSTLWNNNSSVARVSL